MTVTPTPRRTRWISQGLERLIHDTAHRTDNGRAVDYDVVIVGSGYGGAVAADRLAGLVKADGTPLTVCVLERGREYLPGSFPERLSDLAGHVRFNTASHVGARGQFDGLFDMRLGDDVSVLLANGLGGGSLINAGVMAFPEPGVMSDGTWPTVARAADSSKPAVPFPAHAALRARAEQMQVELGAARWVNGALQPNAVAGDTFSAGLPRAGVMQALGGEAVPITVALTQSHTTSAGVQLEKCIACGDCATGCNVGAKDSLDANLLVRAQRKGAQLVTGATVHRVDRAGDAWTVRIWHTNEDLRQRMAEPFTLRAHKVILSAGTLGSTEILMRSQHDSLQFSGELGKGFSGNGDVLAAAFDTKHMVRGVAREAVALAHRRSGPTITHMVDRRSSAGTGFVVQDLGVPAALRRLFEEATATASTLHDMESADDAAHSADAALADPCAVDPAKVDRSLAVALICRDSADGVMRAVADAAATAHDAGVTIVWPSARRDARLDEGCDWLRRELGRSGVGGQFLPNPMWRMLPAGMEELLGAGRGPLVSVHPLGGCRMGDDRKRGVVNGLGQVFDGDTRVGPTVVHPGLVVLDGAIVPTSLGINPSLTIATLADFAVSRLVSDWGLALPADSAPAGKPAERRPVFRTVDPAVGATPLDTQVQVVERLLGQCELDGRLWWMELTLHYGDTPLHRDKAPSLDGHVLPVDADPTVSRVRLFAQRPNTFGVPSEDSQAAFVAPVAGHLRFFHREASTADQRRERAWKAWLVNRGARDAWQAGAEALAEGWDKLTSPSRWFQVDDRVPSASICKRWKQSKALASRAGEVRLFEYKLETGLPTQTDESFKALALVQGLVIEGHKRLTYELRSSPWSQLMRMTLTSFGGLRIGAARTLAVQPMYFAQRQVPLMRIVRQQDQPTALVDVAAFALYAARIMIRIHLWSFRKPDTPEARTPQRLPLPIDGIAQCECIKVPAGTADGTTFRLTRYRTDTGPERRKPVLMIHGYSANGRSFAHETLQEGGLAGYLARRGFEPWVIDLRTSSGLPTRSRPYAFEDIALNDLPVAIRTICERTGFDRIDVVSHCMGSAMLSMAMLAPDHAARYPVENHVRRWVMSQIGPAMRFDPANTLRAFLMRYVQHLLPDLAYELTPGGRTPGVSDDLFDRFLSALPYLEDDDGSEFTVENPWKPWARTPWVGTRHRLDALIGRTFDARRVSRQTLRCIDDFFGPLSLVTMSQPIHFARFTFVTDKSGAMPYGEKRVAERLGRTRPDGGIEMLSLHGADNGLADPSTLDAMATLAAEHLLAWTPVRLARHGHQDCLIGDDTDDVFRRIHQFLR